MKNKISIAIKILVVIAFFAGLSYVSYMKIHAKILTDEKVANHTTIYAEKGYPVYSTVIEKSNVAYFITNITFANNNNNSNRYVALVSQDKAKTIKVGSAVYIPKNEIALREGFSWDDTATYNIGKVTAVSKEADWRTGFYQVTIQLQDKLPELLFYSAKVVSATKKNAVVAPIANLVTSDGKYYAWLIDENSKAVYSPLKTGICDGYNCEIISGIKSGDTLVTSDAKLITDGMLLNNIGENK